MPDRGTMHSHWINLFAPELHGDCDQHQKLAYNKGRDEAIHSDGVSKIHGELS